MSRRDRKTKLDLKVRVSGEPLHFSVDVPVERTTPRKMLPVFRSAAGTVMRFALKAVAERGENISCTAGCAACCRHMVPISASEALRVKEIVSQMPDERREEVEARFADSVSRLASAGLLTRLKAEKQVDREEYHELGLEYFDLGIPCPFLENEACSIYSERPIVCREYVVVSPAENCNRTNGQPVEVVGLPYQVSSTLWKIGSADGVKKWVPLVLALEQSDVEAAPVEGTKIATAFFAELIGMELGKPDSSARGSHPPDHTRKPR